MRKLTWHNSFRRAFKRCVRKNPELRDRIFEVLTALADDPFSASLRTHKLRGRLKGLWSCWVEYDCRIVFAFDPIPDGDEEAIVLIDIGTHDEVY